ncbi:MAG: NAD-dependent epimerase/dehydratase family protein [Williamsia herbipolensis]|nr:NAD-dependent epimerase/dehydratase family protein [Williamsia herbipolensis]
MTGRGDPGIVVTGACGLVGSAVTRELIRRGHRVLATDLDTAANRAAIEKVGRDVRGKGSVSAIWADITDIDQVREVFAHAPITAVIHLAGIIPPFCYAKPDLAYRVNVRGTENLVTALEDTAADCRFVLASSVAVHGPRNPHTCDDLLDATTPTAAADVYGDTKVLAEHAVRGSALPWLILRLGGVIDDRPNLRPDPDLREFERVLPGDGRLQTVSVGDAARAFAAAATADTSGECYMIGGDDSHRLRQEQLSQRISGAMGLPGVVGASAHGDPDDDAAWFATDWMDTREAQRALSFQEQSFDGLLATIGRRMGLLRMVFRVIAPVAAITRRATDRNPVDQSRPVDPWAAASARWGDTRARSR